MTCPHCAATTTSELTKRTQLGYRIFRCTACQRQFNERTGTPYSYLEFPTEIVLLVVLLRLRYKLSLRDLAEWKYRYSAIDQDGNLMGVRIGEYRDMDSAKQLFHLAVETVGHAPDRETTDGHASLCRLLRSSVGLVTPAS